jgi:hypothetical protein
VYLVDKGKIGGFRGDPRDRRGDAGDGIEQAGVGLGVVGIVMRSA